MRNKTLLIPAFLLMLLASVGCQKKDYFTDTGKHTPNFQGSVLSYLKSKPEYFDSIVRIIDLAGMNLVFEQEDITFFAPADSSVNNTLRFLNTILRNQGKKEVTNLKQIKTEVWRDQLSRYIVKGKKSMNDFPQIDPGNLSAFPGQIYSSYAGRIMNIGVIYNDAGGVRYAGYRQLTISYIPSASTPLDFRSWYAATVASVNIAPTNGYVHALRYTFHNFGFDAGHFAEVAMAAGIE